MRKLFLPLLLSAAFFVAGVGTTQAQVKVMTTETFGEKPYDTDASVIKPMGFNKHYNYTEVTTFTSTNGAIKAGTDSSVRIVTYDANNVYPTNYPNPSKGAYILLTKNSGYNGSWDTVVLADVNISALKVKQIEFGYVVSRRFIGIQNHASINVQYRIDGGNWIQTDTTLINNDTLNRSKWQYVTLPVGKVGSKMDVMIYGLTTEQIFIDDIRVIGMKLPQTAGVETFGEKPYDTDASVIKPLGFNKHYNYTEVTTFTSTNGKIKGGSDSSVRIVTYDPGNVYPDNYPSPSKGAYILLTNNSGYNGSWDTVYFADVDIADKIADSVTFGYVVSRRFIGIQNHASINAKYRIDGGTWTQLDTSVINNDTLNRSKWQYVKLAIGKTGTKLDVMIYGLTTEQIFIDDIRVVTSDAPAVAGKETFGEKPYDTDASVIKPLGFNKHYNYTEVTTFTSKNGSIMGGSDSSVRIVTYDPNNVYPSNYPSPSKGAYILLTNNSGYNGSWDTVYYSNVDITDVRVSSIEFGYVVSRRFIGIQNHASINVKYRVDGGSWIQTDTSVINNDTLNRSKWQYVVLKTGVLNGKTMDVMINGLTTEQVFVDDIAVKGYGPLVDTGKQIIKVKGITVTGEGGATTLTSYAGLQMIATLNPDTATNKKVKWTVAPGTGGASIVDSTGLLTASYSGNGTVFVTATATDGSFVFGTTTITVALAPIKVTGITVTGKDGATTITGAGDTLKMSAAIAPKDATDQLITWSVSDATIATITAGGKLIAKANGTVTVIATANDGSGVKGELAITISGQPVSIYNAQTATLDIYPNPASDRITVANSGSIKQLDIFNIDGKLVKSVNSFDEQTSISLSGMNSGIYTVRMLTNKNEVFTSKLVKR